MRTSFFAFASLASFILVGCSGSSGSDVLSPGTDPAPASSSTSTDPNDPSSPSKDPTDPSTDDPKKDPKDDPKNDPTPTPKGPPATAADCDALAAKFCPKASACNHLVAKVLGNDCETRVADICKGHLGAPGSGFTQTALTACGNAYATLGCAQAFGDVPPAACAFAGTLTNGASCAFDDQCLSGACSGNDNSKCGTCGPKTATPSSPKAGLGQTCDNAGQSAPQCNTTLGLWCDSATDKCVEIPFVAIGQACGFVGEDLVMCGPGGTCKYGSTGSGTCVAQKALGASCTAASGYEECVFGAGCIAGKCADPTAAAICK